MKSWTNYPEAISAKKAYNKAKKRKEEQKEIYIFTKKKHEFCEEVLRCEKEIKKANEESPNPQLAPEECEKAVDIATNKRDKAKSQREKEQEKYKEIKAICHEKWQEYQKARKN